QAWWDEIEFSDAETSLPILISPTNSGSFANGSWSGAITVQQPAGLVRLLADDRAGHTGLSNPFGVVVANDLAVSATDSPDPVTLGQSLLYTLTLTNTGPNLSTSVNLTNFLSANVSFISAVASQGSCVYTGGQVRCALGALPSGTNA